MLNLECPYCKKDCEVCHDDGFGCEEGLKYKMECTNCGKSFVFETSILFNYEPEKADCLNGSEHEWAQSQTFPKECTVMQCKICGEERKPTEEEIGDLI